MAPPTRIALAAPFLLLLVSVWAGPSSATTWTWEQPGTVAAGGWNIYWKKYPLFCYSPGDCQFLSNTWRVDDSVESFDTSLDDSLLPSVLPGELMLLVVTSFNDFGESETEHGEVLP